jgi:hypothetical protein
VCEYFDIILFKLWSYIWRYDFVPHFVIWRYGRRKTASGETLNTKSSFPSYAFVRFTLLLVLLIPIWVPCSIFLALYFVFYCLGVPTELVLPLNGKVLNFKLQVQRQIIFILLILKVLQKMEPSFWHLEYTSHNIFPSENEQSRGITSSESSLVEGPAPTTFRHDITVTYQRKRKWYFGFDRFFSSKHKFFTFKGGCNMNGVPNGYGEWRDSDHAGEYLIGNWKDGFPEAPFQSREFIVRS